MAIKRIFSAGGIVIRPLGYDPVSKFDETGSGKEAEKWEVLVTQHSKHKGWDFPKGHREIYESEEQTALREVEEEAGVKAEIIERVGQTQYFYWETEEPVFAPSTLRLYSGPLASLRATVGKEKVLKTVAYYLMKYVGEGEATTAFEVSAKVWLPIDKVEEKLTFKDTKELWEKAKIKIEAISDK
ncbi:hypothetical protein A2697_05220 [Candidatus Curtissbacteria bacterium RIFCSPHIGHO2_01_FULL_41_44]|uniref:Nudix hydrolase domain-containing protein n=1 Tax=Candidatus Curtissbacteria bacterium RIFCSPLOWO2_01_FULL_42_50 TaxID=1797730 RepID=A0A1F5H3A7_9BACT|nr:MAG: hypothetical protein A2697_05220 [Candidatus Curtissbacteria bacterium RIFCSPHIGHO2_01_FULL_41_44]OGD93124.1 MAG: hypothetical protein A3C33_04965 [Candidatus Curtissbacteria bacterium RIFCSPHIGHO2_02_FULL_42_58]OGD96786.1 MAG: hypothetical protein A3E71_01410 [Candidatus Curtissbacteria bacterium RIFCSPHIGHO2_12_FULL_42_33]OGD98646.1 MAG: hypothetical protein A3B54_02695 [Candidatus Curtissbacteria bacterium RIFCSPLOWO2_01_FULL_42_50]OGE02593.1 MAG: hypothetical protein A3G16_03655 [Ca